VPKKPEITPQETLRRFVLRARRIAAHSLVQKPEELLRHAKAEMHLETDASGRTVIRRQFPDDEEVFESLASRVRPLTLTSEPLYYTKVLDAIDRTIGDAAISAEHRTLLDQLRREWVAADLQGTTTQAYAIQSTYLDGTNATAPVSDTQMAAAWLYADLVHADATGPKAEALAFPLTQRYAAAVRLFSHLAILTVSTLRLVESLRDAGVLTVDAAAWEDEVVVGESEWVRKVRLYSAPPGTPMPDLRQSMRLNDQPS
jgi:hypothetical protein